MKVFTIDPDDNITVFASPEQIGELQEGTGRFATEEELARLGYMRCDLHVHTRNSGRCGVPFLSRICRESYNDPQAVYETLKQRGMDLVTVTDHDSIDSVEQLRS